MKLIMLYFNANKCSFRLEGSMCGIIVQDNLLPLSELKVCTRKVLHQEESTSRLGLGVQKIENKQKFWQLLEDSISTGTLTLLVKMFSFNEVLLHFL